MSKVFGILVVFASYNTVCCDLITPQVFIPELTLYYPQNPPKLPVICLTGEKFSFPQCCQNASEWEDVDMSLKILTDYSIPDPERSIFTSFINLVKFILIKEELTCLDALSGPIVRVQVDRPEGKIFKDNSEILKDIETALSNKPKLKAKPIKYSDNIDISNMIPVWRPRGSYRRPKIAPVPIDKAVMTNSTCACTKVTAYPKELQNLSPVTIIGGNLNTLKGISSPCPCSNYQRAYRPSSKLQSLPSTHIKPVVLGCGGNCNLCQRMASPVLAGSGCPKLTTPVSPNSYRNLASSLLAGCPKLASVAPGAVLGCGCPRTKMILGGCPCSNPMLGCPKCGLTNCGCQARQPLSLVQSEAIPLIDCYGNLRKQVKTTVLVPYTMSQIIA